MDSSPDVTATRTIGRTLCDLLATKADTVRASYWAYRKTRFE